MSGNSGRIPHAQNVEVYRVKPGQAKILRTLSEQIAGLFTHYVPSRQGGKSEYCPGAEYCQPTRHKIDVNYKGYIAAETWDDALQIWIPCVAEISEYLERDMRNIYSRGQVWQLFRRVVGAKKKCPVEGKLLEERDPDTFPHAFDLFPTLEAFYHFPGLKLDQVNPLQPRTLVPVSYGDGPGDAAGKKTAQDAPGRQEKRFSAEELHERLEAAKRNLGRSAEATNGKGHHGK